MNRGLGDSAGHERAHDPCRADRQGWTAERPEGSIWEPVADRTALAPYVGTDAGTDADPGGGAGSPYAWPGAVIQEMSFFRAMRASRRRLVRALGVVLPSALLAGFALSLVSAVLVLL